jgi:transposase
MAVRKESQKELEKRRLRGGRLLMKGWSQADVARELDISSTTVSRWAQMVEEGGIEALRIHRARGRPSGLDAAQRRRLGRELKRGAMANDFATEVWTLPRVGLLIERLFERRYSDSQVWRILKAMNWSCQRPTGRATQRDEQAISQWKAKRWPALKKTP